MDTIPTVTEAKTHLDSLIKETHALMAEAAALKARLAEVNERQAALDGTWGRGGLIPAARAALARAEAAERWDAAPVVWLKPYYGDAGEARLLKFTPKQIHVLNFRGSDSTTIFDRETGVNRYSGVIVNLAEIMEYARDRRFSKV